MTRLAFLRVVGSRGAPEVSDPDCAEDGEPGHPARMTNPWVGVCHPWFGWGGVIGGCPLASMPHGFKWIEFGLIFDFFVDRFLIIGEH